LYGISCQYRLFYTLSLVKSSTAWNRSSARQPRDYAAWRHVDELNLRDAAFLWCDVPPSPQPMPSNVSAWYSALASAVTKGDLDFVPQYRDRPQDRRLQRDNQKRNPDLSTIVKRTALQAFAKRNGHDPKFLRDA
jgi:hypothetical protein